MKKETIHLLIFSIVATWILKKKNIWLAKGTPLAAIFLPPFIRTICQLNLLLLYITPKYTIFILHFFPSKLYFVPKKIFHMSLIIDIISQFFLLHLQIPKTNLVGFFFYWSNWVFVYIICTNGLEKYREKNHFWKTANEHVFKTKKLRPRYLL